jgi:NAD(P)-dependent dehydrogenase (short-subunit alcohol dehydrogenase family)
MILKDKVVILAGVGPGMGRRLALAAAQEGARVVLGARSTNVIESVAEEINASGGQALALATDVCDDAQCKRLAQAALQQGDLPHLASRMRGLRRCGRSAFRAGTRRRWGGACAL